MKNKLTVTGYQLSVKKTLLLLFVIFAGNWQLATDNCYALGTTANTKIVDRGNTLQINYYNTSGLGLPAVPGTGVLTANVSAVYGFLLTSSLPSDQSIAKNSTATYNYAFLNKSNIAVTTFFDELNFTNTGSFGSSWTHVFTNTGTTLANNGTQSTDYTVTTPANAGNGSRGISQLSLSISGSNFGAYTGFNTTSYGGVGAYSDTVTTSVVAPDVRVQAKTLKLIQAPTVNGYAGHENDPVPGSIIEYSITLINDGGIASTTTDVTEKIPANSYFLSIPDSSDVTENPGVLGELNNVDYDTDNNGSPDVNAPANSYSGRQAVDHIRFRISAIGIGQTKTLKYRVTVRE